MTEIVLFHSALGLRPAIGVFADKLRAHGHTVHVPDYYDGRVFKDVNEGVAYRDEITREEIARRCNAAVSSLPQDLVYAGFSLGAMQAQRLAQTRPGARGAILMHDGIPSRWFGCPWSRGVALAVHTMDQDPWVDLADARSLVAEARGELHLYPGRAHLFADPDLPEYDVAAAGLMMERVLAFLTRITG